MLIVALAVVAVAPVAASAQSSACPFVSTLKKGSRGSEVTALQAKLGVVQTGYFGNLTAAAVSNYQASKGLPRVGQVGPLTRAALCMDMAGTPNTGNPGVVNPTPVSTSGVEGTLDVKLAASPANNANIQTSTDVPVYGLEFKARVNDVVVQTLDLQAAVTLSGAAENPSTLINTIKVWDGSTVLATIPVNSTTFTKDSSQVYYIRLAGLNFAVAKETTKFLTVSFSSNSIDSDRVVTLDGYNTSSIRAVSGNGISSFYSVDGASYTRTHTFKKPGTSSLTLSSATSPLRSMNYRINPDSGVQGASVLTFNVKSETGDSKILTVNASTTASGTAPTTLYLYDGSTLLASKTVVSSGGNIAFDNLNVVVPKDVTKTLTIKSDWPSNSTTGSAASTTVASVLFEKPNGSSANASGSQIFGVNHYVFSAAPQFALVGVPSISKTSNQGASTTEMSASFTFNVTALGGAMTKPTAATFTVVAATNTTNLLGTAEGTPVTIPNNDIADGSTAQVTVTATLANADVTHSGQYGFAVSSIAWTVGSNTITQTWGLDDFKTPATSFFQK